MHQSQLFKVVSDVGATDGEVERYIVINHTSSTVMPAAVKQLGIV